MRKKKRRRKLAQEKPGSNGESERRTWNVKRRGWAKGMMIGEATKCKKRKGQGANGLVANQSWVMTTSPWARLTDGDHLSALALPRLCRLLTHCAKTLATMSPLKNWHYMHTNKRYTHSAKSECVESANSLIMSEMATIDVGWTLVPDIWNEHHISWKLIIWKDWLD